MQKIEVMMSDSVEDIKRRYGKGIPLNKKVVSHGRQNMRETMSLFSYCIINGSVVTCHLILTCGVLYIKNHAGRSIVKVISCQRGDY